MGHHAVTNHARHDRGLLLGKSQKLVCKLTHRFAVEPGQVSEPNAVEGRKILQWIFRRLAERLGIFDQLSGSHRGRPGFWLSMPLNVKEGCYECDLQTDLVTPPFRRWWQ